MLFSAGQSNGQQTEIILFSDQTMSSTGRRVSDAGVDRLESFSRPRPYGGVVSKPSTDPPVAAAAPAGKYAFLRSLLLPGLGHHYARGRWERSGLIFATVDVGLWLSLFGGEFRRNHLVDSYTTLAAGSANARVDGKDRTFFLNLASFQSSEEFRDIMLRTRQWDRLNYVDDPSFQWRWDSEQDFIRFRELRDDAESLRRRRSVIIASLVANRLIAGILSARRASRDSRVVETNFSLDPAPATGRLPVARLSLTF